MIEQNYAQQQIPNTTGGYMCSNCHSWVPYGTFHSCSTFPVFSSGLSPIFVVDEETKQILRRIADALEKLTNKP